MGMNFYPAKQHMETLSFHHRDPFDRLLIAQAIEDNISTIGLDSIFDKYKVNRIW